MKWVLIALIVQGSSASPAVLRLDMANEAACAAAIRSLSAGMGDALRGATCIEGVR